MYRDDAPATHLSPPTGRPRVDLRYVTFPTPRVYNRPLNLAPVNAPPFDAIPAVPALDAGEHEQSFGDWLLHRAGLDPRSYKPDSLTRRQPACLRSLGVDATVRARALLRRRPELLPKAIDATLVGVTHFFRDADVFATLQRDILPALIGDARTSPLRIWSAGCSRGKELYSAAMLLADLGVTAGRAKLLGTDFRHAAIEAARAGRYPDAVISGTVPPDVRARHLTRDAVGGRMWRVAERLRAMAEWRTGNLLGRTEPGPWDLVLCRNVGIYLRPDAAARLWQALASVIRPGGFLVLGRAERPTGAPGLVPVGPCVYRRVAGFIDELTSCKSGGRS